MGDGLDEDGYLGRQYSVITFPIVQENRALLAGYIMDITDRKRAEEELRNEKRFVEKLLDGLPVLFYLFDKDMRLKRWNRRFQEFSGFGEAQLNGRSPMQASPNSVAIAFLKTILDAPPGEPGAQHMELEVVDSKGNTMPCLISGTRLETDEGPMVMGVAQDISDLKRAEAENEGLIQRLNQVQKLESLGIFAGGIAHDFNNLLGGIFGYLDMANAEKSEEKRRAYLSKALGSIDRARSLTQQLLTFAKGGAPVKKVASLMPFLRETVLFALSGSSVSSAFDVQQGLWPCDFDANQIGQVLDNIVINAVQAMPFGGKIEIRAANASLTEGEHPMLAPGDYVRISIRDTGIGIPKEYLNRIFDPFYTTKPKGHGLGLSTSFSIIHRHNGCIDVESEPGAGSVFHVYLPASAEAAVKACETPASAHSGQGLFLVMDDEPVLRDIIGAMLDSFGYSVIFAENGQEAITLFQDCAGKGQKLSGMIFDLTIPGGMGGKEAIVEIRKLDSALPVFVASGYGDDPVMANPGAYGFTSSLRKPFRRKEIAELLNLGSANGGENPGS
jgi:PAS domain S-box-containing protein